MFVSRVNSVRWHRQVPVDRALQYNDAGQREQGKRSCCRLLRERFPSKAGDLYTHIMNGVQLRGCKAVADQVCKEGYCEPVRQYHGFGAAVRAAREQSKHPHALSKCRWQLPSSKCCRPSLHHDVSLQRRQHTNWIGPLWSQPALHKYRSCGSSPARQAILRTRTAPPVAERR
jgi:hypothetical protein